MFVVTRGASGGRDSEVRVPESLIPFILLQRTSLHRLHAPLRRVRIPERTIARIESRLRGKSIVRDYVAEMYDEFLSVEPYLPPDPGRVLDIGCGAALLDLYLHRHYAGRGHPTTHDLFDRSTLDDRVHYGFATSASAYNSLELARAMLESNGMDPGRIRTHEVDGGTFPAGPFGLVVSLIAWGFHFPVATYLDEVEAALVPGGVLIIDVRRGTDGRERLAEALGPVEVIFEGAKSRRVRVRKPVSEA